VRLQLLLPVVQETQNIAALFIMSCGLAELTVASDTPFGSRAAGSMVTLGRVGLLHFGHVLMDATVAGCDITIFDLDNLIKRK
jgi:hypothetical protein